jgi:hypothetical protein
MATQDLDTRRDFLRKTAIGAAVAGGAWAAPAVLSLDAAHAVGTCPSGSLTFPWSTGGEGTTVYSTSNATPAGSVFVGNIGGATGIDIRVWNNIATGTVAGAGDNWRTRGTPQNNACPPTVNCGSAATTNWPRGNQTSFYSLLMNAQANNGNNGLCNTCAAAGTTGRSTEVTFGFFNPGTTTQHAVRNLAFSLYDIDASTGNYRDEVHVYINGTATEATLGAGANATATRPGAAPTVAAPGATAIFQANAGSSAAANSNNGNIDLQFAANLSINQVRVRFVDTLGSAPQTVQWVGIGNLTFCKT